MTFPLDKLGLMNQALALSGDNQVNVYDDGSPEYRIGSAAYEAAIEYMLDQHNWKGITNTAELQPNLTPPPDPLYIFSYDKPPDCIHLILVRLNELPIKYQLIGNKILIFREQPGFGLENGCYPPGQVPSLIQPVGCPPASTPQNLPGTIQFVGSISGNVLTVTEILTDGATLVVGMTISAAGSNIAVNTYITGFDGGSGGTGTYFISPTGQTVASTTMSYVPPQPSTPIPPRPPHFNPGHLRIKYVSNTNANPANGALSRTFMTALLAFTRAGIYGGLHEDTASEFSWQKIGNEILQQARTRSDQEAPKRSMFNSRIRAARRIRMPWPPVADEWGDVGTPG